MRAKTASSVGLIVVIVSAASLSLGLMQPTRTHETPENASALTRFTGTDDNGDFQAAIEDALAQADAYYDSQGADILYEYRIVRTAGQRGGFAWVNEISVTIVATTQGG